MAYSPRTDLLTPSIGPDTGGIGPGITAGMSNFTALVSQGLSMRNSNQQAQMNRDFSAGQADKQMAYQSAQDDKRFGLMQQRENRMEQKELVSKQEEADFASAAWASIKQQVPEIVTPEMDEKFASGSLGAKRGLLTQTQAAMARAYKEAEEAQKKAEARVPWQAEGPGGVTMYGVGPNVMGKVEPPKPDPSGYKDFGGVGAFLGPKGTPINPDYLVKPGQNGVLAPAIPPPATTPKPIMIEDKPYRLNPATGGLEPIPMGPAPKTAASYYQ